MQKPHFALRFSAIFIVSALALDASSATTYAHTLPQSSSLKFSRSTLFVANQALAAPAAAGFHQGIASVEVIDEAKPFVAQNIFHWLIHSPEEEEVLAFTKQLGNLGHHILDARILIASGKNLRINNGTDYVRFVAPQLGMNQNRLGDFKRFIEKLAHLAVPNEIQFPLSAEEDEAVFILRQLRNTGIPIQFTFDQFAQRLETGRDPEKTFAVIFQKTKAVVIANTTAKKPNAPTLYVQHPWANWLLYMANFPFSDAEFVLPQKCFLIATDRKLPQSLDETFTTNPKKEEWRFRMFPALVLNALFQCLLIGIFFAHTHPAFTESTLLSFAMTTVALCAYLLGTTLRFIKAHPRMITVDANGVIDTRPITTEDKKQIAKFGLNWAIPYLSVLADEFIFGYVLSYETLWPLIIALLLSWLGLGWAYRSTTRWHQNHNIGESHKSTNDQLMLAIFHLTERSYLGRPFTDAIGWIMYTEGIDWVFDLLGPASSVLQKVRQQRIKPQNADELADAVLSISAFKAKGRAELKEITVALRNHFGDAAIGYTLTADEKSAVHILKTVSNNGERNQFILTDVQGLQSLQRTNSIRISSAYVRPGQERPYKITPHGYWVMFAVDYPKSKKKWVTPDPRALLPKPIEKTVGGVSTIATSKQLSELKEDIRSLRIHWTIPDLATELHISSEQLAALPNITTISMARYMELRQRVDKAEGRTPPTQLIPWLQKLKNETAAPEILTLYIGASWPSILKHNASSLAPRVRRALQNLFAALDTDDIPTMLSYLKNHAKDQPNRHRWPILGRAA